MFVHENTTDVEQMFSKKVVKLCYVFCRCSKSVTFEYMECVLHVFKILCALKFEQIQNTFYVFKCNIFRTPAERIHFLSPSLETFIQTYELICSIFLYTHNPQHTKTWTK